MSSAERPPDPPGFRFQFSIASLLLLTTVTAVLLSLGVMSLPLGIGAAVLTIPPFFAMSFVAGWRGAAGYPMTLLEQSLFLLMTTLCVLAVGVFSFLTACCTCVTVLLFGFAATQSIPLDDRSLEVVVWTAAVVGFVAGATVLFRVTRFIVRGIWHDQRSALAALQARDATGGEVCLE